LNFGTPILSREIKERIPPELKIDTVLNTNSPTVLKIKHGLLNPGDSAVIQILLDGSPSEMPPVVCRIAGIKSPKTRFIEKPTASIGPVFLIDSKRSATFVLILSFATSVIWITIAGMFFSGVVFPSLCPRTVIAKKVKDAKQEFASSTTQGTQQAASIFGRNLHEWRGQVVSIIEGAPMLPNEPPDNYAERLGWRIQNEIGPKGLRQRFKHVYREFLIFVLMISAGISVALVSIAGWQRLFR
jgi:hypothetical protein